LLGRARPRDRFQNSHRIGGAVGFALLEILFGVTRFCRRASRKSASGRNTDGDAGFLLLRMGGFPVRMNFFKSR
jgi:hypothetical protein